MRAFIEVPLRLPSWILFIACCAVALGGCRDSEFEFDDPARGPGEFVGNGDAVGVLEYPGGRDEIPEPRDVAINWDTDLPPNCDADCVDHCEASNLDNPVNRGVCHYMWGAGLQNQPVVRAEACRRIFVDMLGRFPTHDDLVQTCEGKTYGEIAINLMSRDEFVLVNQRRWADRLLYDMQAVNVERIYDMDNLVGKLYRGKISYDHFAAVVSAHPVLVRRYDTPEDRAEALFWTFMRRPPLQHERADMGRLYNLWANGYYDHPDLQRRFPDAHIRFRCIDDEGNPNPDTKSECTSVLWGYNELIMKPDIRAQERVDGEATMWSGVLRAEEWEKLQLPGRLIAAEEAFWESVVDDVLQQYLGYDLGTLVPTVRDELVAYLLEHNGDIRALHFAVVTSVPYLQSATGSTSTGYRWTYGPLKQVEAEAWIDTIKHAVGYDLSQCDHRLTRPQDFLDDPAIGTVALVENSLWEFDEEGVDFDYRDIARSLGGCPDNSIGGRFKIVSILTTAQQLNFVNQVCAPGGQGGVAAGRLVPGGIDPAASLTEENGAEIYAHLTRLFTARPPSDDELEEARGWASECSGCTAEQFARPTCFAVLSGAQMLFY